MNHEEAGARAYFGTGITPSDDTLNNAPARMLYSSLRRSERLIQENRAHSDKVRAALTEKTGHGPNRDNGGVTCLCGWKNQGGYPSDHQRAVGNHVLTEWEKAASE